MDWHEILLRLTNLKGSEDFRAKLERILSDVKINEINEFNETDLSLRYVKTLILALEKLNEANEDQDSISVDQFRTTRHSVDLIFVLGIVPNLLPGIGVDPTKIFPKLTTLRLIEDESRSDYQKHCVLRFTVEALLKFFRSFLFRPSIIHRLNLLLPSLLQLCFAPLNKSSSTYARLAEEQSEFRERLTKLTEDCPKFMVTKELMVILGAKETPKWLRIQVRRLLVRLLTRSDGVSNLFAAVCEESTNDSKDWQKFETVSRLVATNHSGDQEKYYSSVCKQLLDLLNSTNKPNHFSTVATVCISTLYKTNPEICRLEIIEPLLEPLSTPKSGISSCVENVCKIFLPSNQTNFNYNLPCEELLRVSLQLFCIFCKLNRSPFALKSKVRQLLLEILSVQGSNNDLFAVFHGQKTTEKYGHRLETKFTSDGDVEIISIVENNGDEFSVENRLDSLRDLSIDRETILNDFFGYLLRFVTEDKVANLVSGSEEILRTKIAAMEMLCKLSNLPTVIKFQLNDPRDLIDLIKSLVDRPDKEEILCIGLMIVKEILAASRRGENKVKMELFRDLAACLKGNEGKSRVVQELIDSVENFEEREKKGEKYFEDFSINQSDNEFEEALRDLGDPLLPIRAHGIVKLTKLVEKRDFHALDRKELILQIFKENLNNDDSFVYLAAINGLCALATSFPGSVIETLMLEYVRIPERFGLGEISLENRCKLGEILVKTTRALGEMAPVHKNLLINGFLCVTRDEDATMRASSLSCLGELCKVLGFRLGNAINEVLYCVASIVQTDKSPDCRRAAVLVSTLLLRGLGKEALNYLAEDLTPLYRGLKRLRDHDEDPILRLHAQLALEEFDGIARDFLANSPKLEKKILLP